MFSSVVDIALKGNKWGLEGKIRMIREVKSNQELRIHDEVSLVSKS